MGGLLKTGTTRRLTPFVLAALLSSGTPLVVGALAGDATAQPPSSASGAKRFDDLRELNNKLGRAITILDRELPLKGSQIKDPGHWTRVLNDLEATKLRAVGQFPDVFGLPYGETFKQLSCVDNEIATGKLALLELEKNYLKGAFAGKYFAGKLVLAGLKKAKSCKDRLELELSSGTGIPTAVSDDLRELNNKLGRAITNLDRELPLKGSQIKDPGHWTRVLNDLEATKLRAVDQFPEILDPPYGETFGQLSCVDNEIATGKLALLELEKDYLKGAFAGRYFAGKLVLAGLKRAKGCKDTLEVELMHSFDLKPSEQNSTGVKPTTPSGTDTQSPNKLNAPKTLEHAYAKDGFIGRHEQDYVAAGVNGSNPDSWPSGRNVLFFNVFDLFGSVSGAQKAETASVQNLKSSGFTPISDSSLGPGEAVFQHQAAGSPLLSTIIYLQHGTFIMKIAGACNGCSKGSIESTLKSEAQSQLNRAVIMGFPAAPSTTSHIPEEFQTSGNAPVYAFGQPGYHLCLYLHGPAGQTGNVKVEPGDSTSQSDPNAQTYNQAFTLDTNGTAFFSFNEPAELFKITINRQEADGSTNTTTTSAETRIHSPPPWGLPDCT